MKLIFKTLAITTLAVAAFGADHRANFQVEFPFHIGKRVMPAGSYSIVSHDSNIHILQICNRQSKELAFITLPVSSDVKASDETASVGFACGAAGCEIANVKNLRRGAALNAWNVKKTGVKTIAVALRSAVKAGE